MGSTTTVGVVVLDYDGGDLTLRCVESALGTDWPADALRIVVVDNGSRHPAAERLRPDLERVTVLEAGTNRGFAGGCNLGIRALGPVDHVALLNNDATVDPGWLAPLVGALEADPSVGAACPKILFEGSFLEIAVTSPAGVPGLGDRRALGVAVSGALLDGVDARRSLQLVSGFWGMEHPPRGGEPFQWTDGHALVRVPVPPGGPRPECLLRLSATEARPVELASGAERVEHTVGPEPAWYPAPLGGEPFDVVNNAGSVLIDGGYGADRGYLERDEGQYDRIEEVFAWCGAAVLLSRRYLEDVGLLEERFFLYYEDFDLSWRGRARGWRHLYVPGPPVRHLHSASTVEGSRLHHHYSERNRLLTLARNAPGRMAVGAAAHHLLVTASYARRDLLAPVIHRRPPSWETVRRRSRSFGSFLGALPPALRERRDLRRRQRVDDGDLLVWSTAPETRPPAARQAGARGSPGPPGRPRAPRK